MKKSAWEEKQREEVRLGAVVRGIVEDAHSAIAAREKGQKRRAHRLARSVRQRIRKLRDNSAALASFLRDSAVRAICEQYQELESPPAYRRQRTA